MNDRNEISPKPDRNRDMIFFPNRNRTEIEGGGGQNRLKFCLLGLYMNHMAGAASSLIFVLRKEMEKFIIILKATNEVV